jgi:DNA-binding NarL/FixJ family response regulator
VALLEPARSIRILSVDDHDLVRKGIAAILSTEADLLLVAEANNGEDAVRLYREHRPDVTLMDLRLPDSSGIETTRTIRREFPDAKIIALTSYDGDQDIYRALEAGVRGYLLKEMVHTEVIRAIRVVHAGKRFIPLEVTQQLNGFFPEVALTPREIEVLALVARGFGNKEIGDTLGTAPGTVKAHVQSILSKLGAKDRTNAVAIALRRGIIHLHSPDLSSSILNG